ncbi:hypothetical protein LY90DRAFT_412418 [Neocallimastix californiae]|uniref:CDP-diacylglycerol--glycerol-3-phosphate 3-phosphatidyltransferase n=1 Tax=Neocallimastix californiae TaxID=1754190 RepID=A0A1Y2D5B4_9FUNG|nr:hypothetical protein LY90DRAFT_412418 [Neocallimastix californiae]|eukprot:ORY54397.1 hypothetical protein LY90DRAFT_412418 [Neocallimastix californiae]
MSILCKQDSLKLQPINISSSFITKKKHLEISLIQGNIIQNSLIQGTIINNLIQKNFYSEKVSTHKEKSKTDKNIIINKSGVKDEKEVKKENFSINRKTILPLFKPLYNESAVFSVDSSKIQIINQPTDYYNKIKEQILNAKHRVVLTALYIGIDQVDLVQTLHKALSKCESLRVTILLDCLRGTRTSNSGESSVTLVAPLVTAFPDRVEVALYHTPELTKPLKMILPQRVNEILGLFHAKIVIADDNILLAGANLSTDYFVNRQDRYVFFGGATSLSDYFYDLANTLTKISYQLAPHHTLIPSGPDPTTNPYQFRKTAFHALNSFLTNWYAKTQPLQKVEMKTEQEIPKLSKDTDTIIIPMLQMKQLQIQENERLMDVIMNIIDSNSDYWKNIFITSGYLNFTNEFKKLLDEIHTDVDILCAAPQANSFYKGAGLSGYIPAVYTYFERKIHDETSNKGLKIHEYVRPGWTYHAKGLWASYRDSETGELLPNVTILGSTNFGRRSMKRDIEAQVLMITDNKKLQKEMANEIKNLLNYTVIVNNETFKKQERHIPLQVKLSTKFFQSMF